MMSQQMPTLTHITPAHREAFEALISGGYENFALFSCFVNGDPAAAIVAINREENDYLITPLFVSITAAMCLSDHDGLQLGPLNALP